MYTHMYILMHGDSTTGREPGVSEDEKKAMMAYYFKKQEELKTLAEVSIACIVRVYKVLLYLSIQRAIYLCAYTYTALANILYIH